MSDIDSKCIHHAKIGRVVRLKIITAHGRTEGGKREKRCQYPLRIEDMCVIARGSESAIHFLITSALQREGGVGRGYASSTGTGRPATAIGRLRGQHYEPGWREGKRKEEGGVCQGTTLEE